MDVENSQTCEEGVLSFRETKRREVHLFPPLSLRLGLLVVLFKPWSLTASSLVWGRSNASMIAPTLGQG
jgi:hypothetical protein